MVASIDVAFMVQETQALVGNRVDNIYEDEQGILFQTHASGKGKVIVRISKQGIWYTTHKPQETILTGFCSQLRKNLKGKKIGFIVQEGSERLICITIGKELLQLVIQLFGSMNIFLCDKEQKILGMHLPQEKQVIGNKIFLPAVSDIRLLQVEELKNLDNIEKTLAKKGLGTIYAREVCVRSGIKPDASSVSEQEAKKIIKTIHQLFTEKISARIVSNNKEFVAVTPFELISLNNYEQEVFPNFSTALDTAYSPTKQAVNNARKKYTSELEKLAVSIEQQEKLAQENEKEALKEQRTGELMYEHYSKIKKLLENFTIARKDHSLAELRKILKDRGIFVDEKTGSISVEVNEYTNK